MTVATQETFGSQVYHELQCLSAFETLTRTLNYEAIQRLKQADQETTLRLFEAAGIPLNSDSELDPKTVATCIVEEARRRAATTGQVAAGITVFDILIEILSGIVALV